MKLNSKKYAFRVGFGKFMAFLILNKGIEANAYKIKLIEEITKMLKDVKVV